MSEWLNDFGLKLTVKEKEWRSQVFNPYLIAYTNAYNSFKEKLDEQKESDEKAGELFVTAACIATSSFLLATVGSATLRLIAKKTVATIASRTLSTSMHNVFRSMRRNEGMIFAVGGFMDTVPDEFKERAGKIIASHQQIVANSITADPLVQFLQMDTIMNQSYNCSVNLARMIDQSGKSAKEKQAALAPLLAAPLANAPKLRAVPLPASMAELIELTFYLTVALESDRLVSWPAYAPRTGLAGKATSTPIAARPSDRASYPNPPSRLPNALGITPAGQSVAISRAGGDVRSRTDELCQKVFGKPLYGSSFFGLMEPSDSQKPAELRQADIWLETLSTKLKPMDPLDAFRC